MKHFQNVLEPQPGNLVLFIIIIISLFMYYIFLCCVFAAIWARSAIDPSYPHDWLLENYLVFATLPVMFATYKWFRLSKVSYTCITIFMILHVIGSHYTYAEVPF